MIDLLTSLTPLLHTYIHTYKHTYVHSTTGVCLVLLLSGADAINTLHEYITQNNHFGPESVFSSSMENQVNYLSDFIFGFTAGSDKGKI